MDILFRLSSCPILDVDGLVSVLLYINTCEDILLVKLVALFFYDTYCDIFLLDLIFTAKLTWLRLESFTSITAIFGWPSNIFIQTFILIFN